MEKLSHFVTLYYCGSVTQLSRFKLAALASSVMPEVQFAGTRQSEQANATDASAGISHAVIQDVSGKLYDIFVSSEMKGRVRLRDRARAAWSLQQTKGLAGLGFAHDEMLNFYPGALRPSNESNDAEKKSSDSQANLNSSVMQGATYGEYKPLKDDNPTVLICSHLRGTARELNLLTTDDCMNVGTALGAIHRLRPTFLQRAKYPAFTTGNIRAQLTGWIKRLRSAGHIPTEITDSWSRVLETEGLWAFDTCPVHGGFSDGDLLFSGSTISAITNWQSMQINDPARDLAWIFAKLNEQKRDALLSSYGRMRGSHLDSLIMLRANLWLQMEQVGDFIQALQNADNIGIMRFKAQVERLAHELNRINGSKAAKNARANSVKPSTLTVGDLLSDDTRSSERKPATGANLKASSDTQIVTDASTDVTAESDVTLDRGAQVKDPTNEHTVQLNDDTNETTSSTSAKSGTFDSIETQVINSINNKEEANEVNENSADDSTAAKATKSTQATQAYETSGDAADNAEDTETRADDATATKATETNTTKAKATETKSDSTKTDNSKANQTKADQTKADSYDAPATIAIPLLEREERAMRDARADLDN